MLGFQGTLCHACEFMHVKAVIGLSVQHLMIAVGPNAIDHADVQVTAVLSTCLHTYSDSISKVMTVVVLQRQQESNAANTDVCMSAYQIESLHQN